MSPISVEQTWLSSQTITQTSDSTVLQCCEGAEQGSDLRLSYQWIDMGEIV